MFWNAIASTPTVAAHVNAPNNGTIPVFNTGGMLVANASTTLYSGNLLGVIADPQTGALSVSDYAWTGSDNNGNASTVFNGITPGPLGYSGPESGTTLGGNRWEARTGSMIRIVRRPTISALRAIVTHRRPQPTGLSLLCFTWLGLGLRRRCTK